MAYILPTLLCNVHNSLDVPYKPFKLVRGKYAYYHYLCDAFNDVGWGCGYRTLQTLCSWIFFNIVESDTKSKSTKSYEIPTIMDIQNALVAMQDKPSSFIKSKEWIGSFEVCLCLDYFYDVPCKIHHVRNHESLCSIYDLLITHFDTFASPVMMGGDSDAASKCILGICGSNSNNCYLLILDPHCKTKPTVTSLVEDKWLCWRHIDSFVKSSFYNLCLPQSVSIEKG